MLRGGSTVATMRFPLTMRNMLMRARLFYPNKEIVTRTASGLHRYTYKDYYARTCQLAHALRKLGVGRGDRVATLAWNNYRHLETYFAAPVMGAVLHTLNFRLPADHLAYVINHAEDKVILVEAELIPVLEAVFDKLTTVKHFIVMADKGERWEAGLYPAHHYEELIEQEPTEYPWPEDIDEWDPAGLCYTSATTGNPKGVLYTHRAIYLDVMASCMADVLGLTEHDTVLPYVPMFHVNAWGLPFAACWIGAKLVLPGSRPTPKDVVDLAVSEKVTLAAGVPTIWMGVLQYLEQNPHLDISSLNRVVSGGSAVPQALLENFSKRGVTVIHAYGMTEATPLTHVCKIKSHMQDWPLAEQNRVRSYQGMLAPGLEIRLVDDRGHDVAWDGKSMGEVWMRGPWIADEYYRDERSAQTFVDGWYHSGDVATMDEEGYLRIVDRTKDVIKSGGEWISSVDLENWLMAFPAVAEATVIAVPHAKWDERPLACVVLKPAQKETTSKEAILEHMASRFPKWWVPDDVAFIDEIPKTGTGKFDKKVLRERFTMHYGGMAAREGPRHAGD